MLKKIVVFFTVIIFFTSTFEISEAAYTAYDEYSTVNINQTRKNRKNNRTSKKRTKKSTKRRTTSKKTKRNTKKTKKSKTKNRKNYFLDEENNFIVSQEELPQEGQTNNDVLPDDSIIATTIDEQQNLNEDSNKNNNNGLIVIEKQPEPKQEEKPKSSFFDRFYVKHNIYAGYSMESYKSQMFNNLESIPVEYYNNMEIKNKANSLVVGVGEALYFKINDTFHPFVGLDLQFKNNAKMKTNIAYDSNVDALPTAQATAYAVANIINSMIKQVYNTYTAKRVVNLATLFSIGTLDNVINSIVLQDYGSVTGKFGIKINPFKKNILSISPYGIFGVNFTRLQTSISPYMAGEHRFNVYIPTGYTVNSIVNNNDGTYEFDFNQVSEDEIKQYFLSLQNVKKKTNNFGKIFGAGIEFTINNIFVIGAEYRMSERNATGLFFEHCNISEHRIDNTTFDSTYTFYNVYMKKVKIHSIIGKFGIQF